MVLRESLDPDTSLWHWIAVDLHFYRVKHGLSCAQLGQSLRVNRQAVSNMEAARPGFRLDETKAKILDELWQLNGHFQRLLRYARAGHDVEWFKQHTEYENRAHTIKTWEVSFVPGLLQTPEYARALLVAGQIVEDVEAALAIRMERQQILDRSPRPLLWVLLGESALEWAVGGPEVMRAQLTSLLADTERPGITIRVVPKRAGAHPGLDGSFKILGGREETAFVEAPEGGRLIVGAEEVRRFAVRYDRIGAVALPVDSSRSLIVQAMERMK